jgi:hypothetical protein
MPIAPETVTLSGSGLVFNNSYGANVSATFRTTIVAAENYFQSHFTNAVTLNINFDTQPLARSIAGENIGSSSNPVQQISYAALTGALRAHATTADDIAAVASLPAADPSQGQGFSVPIGMARILGLAGPGSGSPDQTIILNSNLPFTYGADALGVVEHEISELSMGRVGGLGLGNNGWGPMDLFRYTASGQHDYTGGRDGQPTYFSVDGIKILTQFQFHSSVSTGGTNDGFDVADWDKTVGDAFGPGGPGSPSSISATDLRVMDILGWTPTGSATVPAVTDDYANSLTDTSHPFGQVAVNGLSTGTIEINGDRDWFRVQLTAGTAYTLNLQGLHSGGGTLEDPYLRLHDSTGILLAQNDDIVQGVNRDSQLAFTATTSGTYYLEAGAFNDQYTGTYTVSIVAAAAQSAAIAVAGRAPELAFDAAYYLARNSDVMAAGIDAQQHYDSFGWKEGRNPDAVFNTSYYLAHNPDVAAAGIDPLLHFETFGWKEGRDPGPAFSVASYLAHNQDVALAGINPLDHYLLYGITEHRSL